MRKYIKRIFLALALAGALGAVTQPLLATTEKIQQNELDRLYQQFRAWLSMWFWPAGYLPPQLPSPDLMPATPPPDPRLPFGDEIIEDGKKVLESLK